MRYWAKLMLTGVPVIVTWRSVVPSSWLPILIWAPDTCLISLILVPWRPMIEPISCERAEAETDRSVWWKKQTCFTRKGFDKSFDWLRLFLIAGCNADGSDSNKKTKSKRTIKKCAVMLGWLNAVHLEYCNYIVFSGLLIHHACQKHFFFSRSLP